MRRVSLPLTRLVHENLSILMCFAYSRKPLADLLTEKFSGEWKYLRKALLDVSEERAEKACLELALFLRMIDDEEEISEYLKKIKIVPNCGGLIMKTGSPQILTFREVTNKIIHSSRLEWNFANSHPTLICHSSNEKWVQAKVDLAGFASVCGNLMS
jgi:hypothetical protein